MDIGGRSSWILTMCDDFPLPLVFGGTFSNILTKADPKIHPENHEWNKVETWLIWQPAYFL